MLSEINLLPTREKRSPFFLITLAAILLIGLIGTGLLFMQYQSVSKEKTMKESEEKVIAKLIEEEMQKLLLDSAQTEIKQYEQVVQVVTQLPLQTVKILDEVTTALPKSGYFKSYMYQDTGTISIIADFGSLEDTAQYLHELTYSDWVEKVETSSITKIEENEVQTKALYNGSYTIQLRRDAFTRLKGDGAK
ncbi:PilN domain-containing protein [Paenibacillus solani]|uniref:Fimbrial assembly protein n=1 Tax=Paenibacillus solani TaxID=1705565 RepID=A0A0M1NZQ9_9BACL|nr:hypothetical protein [Paenibacillus solani]KOR87706.1 hypothetical protein AM231_00170 [Paenibacillus solani]